MLNRFIIKVGGLNWFLISDWIEKFLISFIF